MDRDFSRSGKDTSESGDGRDTSGGAEATGCVTETFSGDAMAIDDDAIADTSTAARDTADVETEPPQTGAGERPSSFAAHKAHNCKVHSPQGPEGSHGPQPHSQQGLQPAATCRAHNHLQGPQPPQGLALRLAIIMIIIILGPIIIFIMFS